MCRWARKPSTISVATPSQNTARIAPDNPLTAHCGSLTRPLASAHQPRARPRADPARAKIVTSATSGRRTPSSTRPPQSTPPAAKAPTTAAISHAWTLPPKRFRSCTTAVVTEGVKASSHVGRFSPLSPGRRPPMRGRFWKSVLGSTFMTVCLWLVPCRPAMAAQPPRGTIESGNTTPFTRHCIVRRSAATWGSARIGPAAWKLSHGHRTGEAGQPLGTSGVSATAHPAERWP